MPTLDNGQWVPDDHPLYADEQRRKRIDAQVPAGAKVQAPGLQTSANPDDFRAAQVQSGMTAQRPGTNPYGDDALAKPYSDPTPQAGPTRSTPPDPNLAGDQRTGLEPVPPAGAAPAPAGPPALPGGATYMGDPNDPNALVRLPTGQVLPQSHPEYQKWAASQTAAAPPAGGAPPAAPGAPPGTPGSAQGDPIGTQAKNAQTYSQTPGAAPANNTTNQGTQDVIRNLLLERATQGTDIDRTDPAFRQQADAFAAAQERARRNAVDDSAEEAFASGMRGSGAATVERRMISENAARNVGQFEAELVGRELQSRRAEVASAIESLKGQISVDQQLALQRELAALDAALKREGLAQTGSLGERDLSLRDKLGSGALNVDLMRALLQNQQFNTSTGVNIGQSEMDFYLRQLGL